MRDAIAKKMSHITAIGRPIDITYRPNLMMLIAVSLIGIVVFAFNYSAGIDSAISSAIVAAIAAGASWVVARELDPEHDYSAFVGMIPAVLLVEGGIDLWTIGAFIMLMRVLSRVVGPPAYIGDALMTMVVVGFAIFATGGWLMSVIGILVFVLDARLHNPAPRHTIFAGGIALITLFYALTQGINALALPGLETVFVLVLITAGYMIQIRRSGKINITADYGEKYPINQMRVKISMLISVLGVLAISLWGGADAIQQLIPIWTAIGGVVVYGLFRQLTHAQTVFKPLLSSLFS